MALWDILAGAGCGRCGLLALEAVEEAAGVVALMVAAVVMEVLPAWYCGSAVLPRAKALQRAVSSIPVALHVPTLNVTHLVATAFLTLRVRAGGKPFLDLAVLAAVADRAAAGERVRFVQVFDAHASVLAQTGWVCFLTVRA